MFIIYITYYIYKVLYNLYLKGDIYMDSSILYKVPSKNNTDLYDIYKDYKVIKKILNNYNTLMTSAIQEGNLNVIDILVDIKATLSSIEMSDKQNERLSLFMYGYSETDIGDKLNVSRQSIQDSINSVCKKICKELQGIKTCSA